MDRKTNIRKISVTPDSGKHVSDTRMLKGEGKETSAQKATNDLSDYTTGTAPRGTLGGKPTRT